MTGGPRQELLVVAVLGDEPDREVVNARLVDLGGNHYSCCFGVDGEIIGTWDSNGCTAAIGRVIPPVQHGWDATRWQNPHGLKFQAGDIIEFAKVDVVTLLGLLAGNTDDGATPPEDFGKEKP